MTAIPTAREIKEAINELLEKAEAVPSMALWRALVPTDPRLKKHAPAGKTYAATFAYQETHELNKLLMLIHRILDEGGYKEEDEVRIKLIGYCQIMESDLPLALIWNLLRVIGKEEASWVFKEEAEWIFEKGPQDCINASDKLKAIRLRADRLGLRIGQVLDSIWDIDIRNAFSHGHYILSCGYLQRSRSLSPISSGGRHRQSRRKENPSYQEVRDRYEAARSFLFTLSDAHVKFYNKMRARHLRPMSEMEPK
jgi:hypothetical protein